jgi:hypothetical protein
MKRKFAAGVVVCFVFALSVCGAQEVKHVTVAGRDVAIWKPVVRFPLVDIRWFCFRMDLAGAIRRQRS